MGPWTSCTMPASALPCFPGEMAGTCGGAGGGGGQRPASPRAPWVPEPRGFLVRRGCNCDKYRVQPADTPPTACPSPSHPPPPTRGLVNGWRVETGAPSLPKDEALARRQTMQHTMQQRVQTATPGSGQARGKAVAADIPAAQAGTSGAPPRTEEAASAPHPGPASTGERAGCLLCWGGLLACVAVRLSGGSRAPGALTPDLSPH